MKKIVSGIVSLSVGVAVWLSGPVASRADCAYCFEGLCGYEVNSEFCAQASSSGTSSSTSGTVGGSITGPSGSVTGSSGDNSSSSCTTSHNSDCQKLAAEVNAPVPQDTQGVCMDLVRMVCYPCTVNKSTCG